MEKIKVDYEKCSRFIKRELKIELFPYQEVMLKAFCEGLEVRTARGIGRSFVADAFGKYVASTVASNDHDADPDVVLPYTCALKDGVWDERDVRSMLGEGDREWCEEWFRREVLCQ